MKELIGIIFIIILAVLWCNDLEQRDKNTENYVSPTGPSNVEVISPLDSLNANDSLNTIDSLIKL